MREIKFRAWDTEYKKMTIVYTLDELLANADPLYNVVKEDYIWMQFTGLTDSEGKPIYEGDILQWFSWKLPISIDDYHGYRFMFGKDQLNRGIANDGKIIGNIYEEKNEVSNDTK